MNLHSFVFLKGPVTISYNQVHTIIFFLHSLGSKRKTKKGKQIQPGILGDTHCDLFSVHMCVCVVFVCVCVCRLERNFNIFSFLLIGIMYKCDPTEKGLSILSMGMKRFKRWRNTTISNLRKHILISTLPLGSAHVNHNNSLTFYIYLYILCTKSVCFLSWKKRKDPESLRRGVFFDKSRACSLPPEYNNNKKSVWCLSSPS